VDKNIPYLNGMISEDVRTTTIVRVDVLDMLRGTAAAFVVIAPTTIIGFYGVEPHWNLLNWTPLWILWSGHQAVILFFVVSGFALARIMKSLQGESYFPYLFARILRLYPPYFASLLVAFSLYWLLEEMGFIWQAGELNVPKPVLDEKLIINHILMIGYFNTSALNPPVWSPVHEMRLSIFFPAIFALALCWGNKAVIAGLLFSLFLGTGAWFGTYGGVSPAIRDILLTAHYGKLFLIGAMISIHIESLAGKVQALSKNGRNG